MRDEREDDLSLDEALSAGEAEFTSPRPNGKKVWLNFPGLVANADGFCWQLKYLFQISPLSYSWENDPI